MSPKWKDEKGQLVDLPVSVEDVRLALHCISSIPGAGGFVVTNIWITADGKLVVEYDNEEA